MNEIVLSKDLLEIVAKALDRINQSPETTNGDALFYATKNRFTADVRKRLIKEIRSKRPPRVTTAQQARNKKKALSAPTL